MPVERTLVLVKPDGVRRGLIGETIRRFENKGFRIAALRMLKFTPELADRHYVDHVAKSFYPELKSFILSGPVVALVVEGPDAISLVRKMMGATKPADSLPGTLRGDFANTTTENIVHGSDSPEKAAYEASLYFSAQELA